MIAAAAVAGVSPVEGEAPVARKETNSSQPTTTSPPSEPVQAQQGLGNRRPIIGCMPDYGCYFTGDFLYWRAENQGFSYAFNRTSASDFIEGNIERIEPQWDPAFRIGIGWSTDHDYWDIFFNWTWYQNHATQTDERLTIPDSTPFGYLAMFPQQTTGITGSFRRVYASWRLLYNAIDFELGRAFYLTRALSLRPFWGVRGAWLRQTFFNDFTSQVQPILASVRSQIQFLGVNNYWGVGPRVGNATEWHLGYGFSFLGRLSGALLYGNTATEFSLFDSQSVGVPVALEQHYQDNFSQLVPTAQLALGLNWGTCFGKKNGSYFGLNGNWETNYYWNQFNLPVTIYGDPAPLPTTGNQPVTMEGFTLNAQINF
jgi:hypothetical protein